jgi:hypothetical protein
MEVIFMRGTIFLLFLMTLPSIQGCAVPILVASAAVGGAGLAAGGVGVAKGQAKQAKAIDMEARAKYTENYNKYVIEVEKMNLEREKSKLPQKRILSFDEWITTQPLTADEAALFRPQNIPIQESRIEKEKTTGDTLSEKKPGSPSGND